MNRASLLPIGLLLWTSTQLQQAHFCEASRKSNFNSKPPQKKQPSFPLHIKVTPKVTLASNSAPQQERMIDLEPLGLTPLDGRYETGPLGTMKRIGEVMDDLTSTEEKVKEDTPKESKPANSSTNANGISKPAVLLGMLGSAVYVLASKSIKKKAPPLIRGGRQRVVDMLTHSTNKQTQQRTKRTPADDHPLAIQSEAIIREKGVLAWLFSWEKLPWTLSAMVSSFYLVAFISRVSCDKPDSSFGQAMCFQPLTKLTQGLHNGFCVWGSDPTTGLCASELQNSHQYSFYVDTILTLLTFTIGHLVQPHASFLYTAGIGLLIGLHGILHLGISNGIQCDGMWKQCHCWMTCPGSETKPAQPWQWILYTVYNFGLVVLDFVVANFRLPIPLQAVLVTVVTTLFVAFGVYLGGAWALTALFVQSHVMASITGIFANQNKITPLTGWCFLAASCVGVVEFLACEPFLLKRYGHVWYDAILHLAMISTLIPTRKQGIVGP